MTDPRRSLVCDLFMKAATCGFFLFVLGLLQLNSPHPVDALNSAPFANANLSAVTNPQKAAPGPLRILASNSRYFTDGSGRAIYLAGSHTWEDMLEMGYSDPPPSFDFNEFLTFLHNHNHNFSRLWTCALPRGTQVSVGNCYPLPWERTGPGEAADGRPRFDLTKFNPAYFDRLRSRVMMAGAQGIYVSVMLFDGYAVQFDRHPDDGYPLDEGNNINGIAAPDTTSQDLSRPAVTAVQDAYVRKVIDTVNDFDNVLYEVANEAGSYSTKWQYHIVDLVKRYESGMPKQHPVGMTFQHKGGTDATLYDSPADWVSPSATLPPEATGNKVIINDTDHSFYYTAMQSSGYGGQRAWAWENFARGNNLAFMDPYLWVWPGRNAPRGDKVDPYWEEIRSALGDIRSYADRMDLASMTPQRDLVVGGGFCLASAGAQYLVFEPSPERRVDRIVGWFAGNTFELNLMPGTYAYEWFNPASHSVVETGTVTVATRHTFAAPFSGAAVLWLHK